MKIISPIPPSVNSYLKYRVQRGKNGKIFVQTYKSEEARKYEAIFEDIVREAIEKNKWIKPDKESYVFINAVFYFPRHHMDANNHWKLPLDVFTFAGVYPDDSKALERAHRVFIDKDHPRVEFEITVAPYLGVFDDEKHLEEFKNFNCRFCTKKPEKCNMMKNALNNKIMRDEINLEKLSCLRKKIKKT